MLRDETLLRRLAPGNSLLVGTVDAAGWPACCRAVALSVHEDRQGVTVYVPVAAGEETVANITAGGRLALLASNPVDHASVQLKGRSRGVRVAGEDERDAVERWFEHFLEVLAAVGLPRGVSRTLNRWPAFAIDVLVDAVFDQTPGPRAGALLRQRGAE